jgi:hypothetical protein
MGGREVCGEVAALGWAADENTSGQAGPVPVELAEAGFHPAACLAGGLWAGAHGLYGLAVADLLLSALALPAVSMLLAWPGPASGLVALAVGGGWLALRMWMGWHGHRWAWGRRLFADLDDYWAVQRTWLVVGLGAAGVAVVVTLLLASWLAAAPGAQG